MERMFLEAKRLAREKARGIWPDRLLTDYLDRWATQRPNQLALVAQRQGQATSTRLAWRELARQVDAIVSGLAAHGIAKGDVVSFQLPNWWQFVAIHLACVRLGAVSNPLMPILRERELAFMLKHSESKVLIAPARFRGFDHGRLALGLQRDLPSLKRVFLVDGEGENAFETLMSGCAAENQNASSAPLGADEVVQLLYTSGTTGEPKGVLHTSNTLIGTTLKFAERLELTQADVVFMPSPLAHQAGFTYGLILALILGAPLVIMDVWDPARALEMMEEHRVTYTFAATPFLADLANFPGVEKRALKAFRLFVTAGAPIPPSVVDLALRRLNATVIASWGMTECCSPTTTLLSGYKVRESDGIGMPGSEVRVVDEHGNEAARGRAGSLQVRGASLFVGYLKRPLLYTLDENGWFETGDIARMDADGYIRICGRTKDIIIRGGENIPVTQVESVLYQMQEIAEVAIVAMPDARLSERACAFVTLRERQHLALGQVRAFLSAEGVAKQFWPERIEIIDQMPRTPTGKIQKFVLRERAQTLCADQADELSPA